MESHIQQMLVLLGVILCCLAWLPFIIAVQHYIDKRTKIKERKKEKDKYESNN